MSRAKNRIKVLTQELKNNQPELVPHKTIKEPKLPKPPAGIIAKKIITIPVPEYIQKLNLETETAQNIELEDIEKDMAHTAQEVEDAKKLNKEAQLQLNRTELMLQKAERKQETVEHRLKLVQMRATESQIRHETIVILAGHDPKEMMPSLNEKGEIMIMTKQG